MFFYLPDDARDIRSNLQTLFDENEPLPEQSLLDLADYGAYTDDSEQGATLRRLILEIEDLLLQLRWHVAQVLLIWKAFPSLWRPNSEDNEHFAKFGFASKALLLLRPYIIDQFRVYDSDLTEKAPRGGTLGGWVLHMLVDSSVERSTAILDRLAGLVALVSGVTFNNHKVYFRSKKLSAIREQIGAKLGDPLVELAEGDSIKFLLDYRDGLAHHNRYTSAVSGTPAGDHWTDDQGINHWSQMTGWGAEELVSIALLAYHMPCSVLPHVIAICRARTGNQCNKSESEP